MSEQRTWIGRFSLYGLVVAATFPKAVGVTAAIMTRQTGRDVWAAEIVAIGAALLLVALTAFLISRLQEAPLRALERSVGPWLARPLAMVEALFFCLLYLAGAYTFLAHTQFFFLPETPLIVFLLAMAILSLVGSHYGLEVLARTALLSTVGHLGITAIMIPGVIWDVDLLNLWPIGGGGWGSFGVASLTGLADLVQPIPLLLAFLPETGGPRGHLRHSVLAMLAAGLLILIWPLAEITVLGPGLTAQQGVACMGLARTASLGAYLHRYELVMLLFFMPGVFLVEVLPFLAASRSLAHAIGVSNHKALFLPLIVAITGVSWWLFADRLRTDQFFTYVWPWAVLALGGMLLAAAALAVVVQSVRGVARVSQ